MPRNPMRPRRRGGRFNAGPAVLAVVVLGGLAAAISGNGSSQTGGTNAPVAAAQTGEQRVRFSMCGRDRHTCVVDGDTIWLDGVNLRLESYDTPEPHDQICGGQAEVTLANRASARLLQLLNSNAFTVETHGVDRYDRTLATIRIGGTDVGDILISEGLARRWPNGDEFWC